MLREQAKPYRTDNDRWEIRWTDLSGRRRKKRFDRYKDAQRALTDIHRQQDLHAAGNGLPTSSLGMTFDELADLYLTHRTARKRSPKDDQSIIRAHLRPYFGPRRVEQIRTTMIEEFTARLEDCSEKTVLNILTTLGSMLRWAKTKNWLIDIPKFDRPSVVYDPKNYRWLKTNSEVRRFLRSAREEGTAVHAMYATALFTGMRAGELAALRWNDIDPDRRLITVARSFKKPVTKNGRSRHVPIVDALEPILSHWKGCRPHDTLAFPNRAGHMHAPSARIFEEVLHRVLNRSGLPHGYITFHSLRHSFASHWVANGGDLYSLQLVLGHSSISMTQRYAHLSPSRFGRDFGRFNGMSG
jgi:integrase